MLVLFTVLHFLVDGICGAVLAEYAVQEPFLEPIVYCFGLYNAFAFGTQWLTGCLFDRKSSWLGGSFLFAAAALAAGSVPALGIGQQAVLLGIGNSIFHVAAGSLVLQRYTTYKELGIFVSSGAIGLALGLNCLVGPYPFLLACIVLSAVVTWRLCRTDSEYTGFIVGKSNAGCSFAGCGNTRAKSGPLPEDVMTVDAPLSLAAAVSLVLLLGCIVLRGLGSGNTFSSYVMLFPCVFAAGKALGGVLCDRAGYKNTILIIFLLCFVALQLSGLVASVLLVLAFNMTMPLTLRLAHWCNPRYPGMMFGMAAGCLLPGVYFHGFSIAPQAMAVLQFLCLAAAGYLLRKRMGMLSKEED